jgi:hypothetical protein
MDLDCLLAIRRNPRVAIIVGLSCLPDTANGRDKVSIRYRLSGHAIADIEPSFMLRSVGW